MPPKLKAIIGFWDIWSTFWINEAYHLVNTAACWCQSSAYGPENISVQFQLWLINIPYAVCLVYIQGMWEMLLFFEYLMSLQLWNFIPIWYKSGWAGSCLWEQGTALTFLTRLLFFFYKSASRQLFKTETVCFCEGEFGITFFFLLSSLRLLLKGSKYTGTARYVVRWVACNFF